MSLCDRSTMAWTDCVPRVCEDNPQRPQNQPVGLRYSPCMLREYKQYSPCVRRWPFITFEDDQLVKGVPCMYGDGPQQTIRALIQRICSPCVRGWPLSNITRVYEASPVTTDIFIKICSYSPLPRGFSQFYFSKIFLYKSKGHRPLVFFRCLYL